VFSVVAELEMGVLVVLKVLSVGVLFLVARALCMEMKRKSSIRQVNLNYKLIPFTLKSILVTYKSERVLVPNSILSHFHHQITFS
jgi:hypothetical protein